MANKNYVASAELQTIYAPGVDYSGLAETTISGMIAVASRWVDSFTQAPKGWDHETISLEQYDSNSGVRIDGDGNLVIFPIKRPVEVEAVSGINIFLGGFSTDLTLTSGGNSLLSIPSPADQIIYPNGYLVSVGTILGGQGRLNQLRSFRFGVKLSYSGGYRTIPEDIKMAVGLYVQYLNANRYNPSGGIEVRQGSMAVKYAGAANQDSPLVLQAKDLLNNYVRVT